MLMKILNFLVKKVSKDKSFICSRKRINNLVDICDLYNDEAMRLLKVLKEYGIDTDEAIQKYSRMKEVYIERWKE